MAKRWTNWMDFLLIVEYPVTPDTRALAARLRVTHEAFRCKAIALGLKRLVPNSSWGSETLKERRFIQKNYLTMPSKRIADKLGRSDLFVRGVLKRLQLTIPPEIIEQRKLESRIKPGHVPPNKGKKREEFLSAAAIRKMKRTQFKKGHLPKNTLCDGAIQIRADKNGHSYKFIRIIAGYWEPLQRYVWRQHHGPIPKGHNIVFKDGNTLNTDISNLECISRAENARRNRHWNRWPTELSEALMASMQLNRRIKKIEKQLSNEKQDHGSQGSHVRAAGKAGRRKYQKRGPGKGTAQVKSHGRYRKGNRGKRKDRAAAR